MRFLVLLCCVFFLLSVTVSPTQAAQRPSCPPLAPGNGNVSYPPIIPGILVINELLTDPGSKTLWNCSAQTNSPWLELFNTQNQAYDLSSFAAFDHGPGTIHYYLTGNVTIAAHGHLVIFPSLNIFSGQKPLIRLLFEGVVIDQVTVPVLTVDQSYARVPDGSKNWQTTSTPTIGASNTPAATPIVATPSPSLQKNGTTTSQIVRGGLSQQSTNSHTNRLPTETQHMPASPQTIGTQPAWNNLHLPQAVSTMPSSSKTITLPAFPTSTIKSPVWPLLPGLLGLAGFSVALGIFFYRYRQRRKAT